MELLLIPAFLACMVILYPGLVLLAILLWKDRHE